MRRKNAVAIPIVFTRSSSFNGIMSQPFNSFKFFKPSKLPDSPSNRQNWLANVPLQVFLTVPFVIQLVGTVSLVGYLSYRSGQQSVEDLAEHLVTETGERVVQKLDSHLQGAQQLNQASIAALESGAIRLDSLDQIHRYLIVQHQHYPDITSFLFGDPQGNFRTIHHVSPSEVEAGLTQVQPTDLPFEAGQSDPNQPSRLNLYTIDEKGNLGRFLEALDNIDVRERPWYRRAVEAGKPGWSEPFQIGASNLLAINAYAPVYDETQQLQGVFSVNLSFERLDQFLETLSIGETGQVFILEKNGLLLASSAKEAEYLTSTSKPLAPSNPAAPDAPDAALAKQPGEIRFQRLAASESSNSLIKDAAQQLNLAFSDLNAITSAQNLTFRIKGKLHYLHIFPYRDPYSLDWLVVTVVPETDFMAQIHANQRQTIELCVLTAGLALATGLLTARWIAAPIRRLQQAADAIARGQFDTPIPTDGVGEVAQLAEQFRRMSHQLSIFFETAQASEEKFAELLNDLPIGVSVFDANGQRVYINWIGEQMLGQGANAELLSLNVEQITGLYPIYRAGTNERYPQEELPFMRALRGESVTVDDFEIEIEGQRLPLEVQTIPIWDQQGQVIYAINVFQDITERRRVAQLQEEHQHELEQALTQQAEAFLQSETRFRFAVDQMPDVFVLYDAERRFQFVNARGVEVSGLSLDDHLGKRDEDLYPPEVTDTYLPLLKTAIATRTMQMGECTIALPDREPFTIIVKYAPLLDQDGSIRQVVALTYDITPRKRAEQALQASEERFRQIAESINQVFLIRDASSGQFLYVSPAYEKIWGRSCQSLYDNPTSWLEAIYPDDLPIVEQSLEQQFRGLPIHREYRIQRSDGLIRWIHAVISVVQDDEGHVLRYTGLAEDITERKQAELALQRTTQQLQTFLQNAPVIISLFDMAGRYLQVNPAFAALLNRPASEIVGQTFADLHPQPVVDRFHARLQQIRESGLPLNVDDELVINDEVKTFQSILFPVMDEQGSITSIWALSTDISDRKRMELALQETNERQQALLSVMPDLMYVVDADGVVLDQVTYRPSRDLYSGDGDIDRRQTTIFDVGTPEVVNRKVTALEAALATGKIQIYEQTVEKDGVTWCEEARCVPMSSNRALFMFRDISDRKAAELAMQETNARQQALLSVMPDLMFVVAADGAILEKITQRPELDLFVPDEGIEQDNITCVGDSDNVQRKKLAIQQVLATGKTQIYEQMVEKNGRSWYEEVRCVPMPGERVLFMLRDISERYRIDQIKDEFISIVSHELRTPLTAIRGSLGILDSGVLDDDPEQAKALLAIAAKNSERLVRLVNDILDLERLESGKTELEMQVCPVSMLLQAAIEAVQAIAEADNITLVVTQTDTNLYVAPDAIVQTLTNLLSNAIKFSDPGSTVWVTAEPATGSDAEFGPEFGPEFSSEFGSEFASRVEPDREPNFSLALKNHALHTTLHTVTHRDVPYWQFSVRDQGRGIPADKQKLIFDRFQQIDVSDTRQKGGTGLGLAICRTIIWQHGGRIWVESEVGQGSVFYFTVPCWRNKRDEAHSRH